VGRDFFVSALRSSGSKLPRHGLFPIVSSFLPQILLHQGVGYLGLLCSPAGINPLATKGGALRWDLR
jgi:hypothetical protein